MLARGRGRAPVRSGACHAKDERPCTGFWEEWALDAALHVPCTVWLALALAAGSLTPLAQPACDLQGILPNGMHMVHCHSALLQACTARVI